MKKNIFFFLFLVIVFNSFAQHFTLPYETQDYNTTLDYKSMMRLCHQVDAQYEEVSFGSFGLSAQGDTLPLLVIGRKNALTPEACRSKDKIVLLVEAGIHPGEPEGVEAGFLFLRDLMENKEVSPLLDKITILFIPSFNVDGLKRFGPHNRINQNGPAEMGWRTNAQNLNLNRDFLKADAPEMKSWLKMFYTWNPDFMIDCHTTDGADYQYVLTYGFDTPGFMYPEFTQWLNTSYLGYLKKGMNEKEMKIFPYISFREWHDPRSGLFSYPSSPMLSHGYTLLTDRPSLLLETHMLKPYKQRVDATYRMIFLTSKLLSENADKFKKYIRLSDANRLKLKGGDSLALSYRTGSDSVMIDFEGFEYDMVKSDLTGGDWFIYHPGKPETMHLPFFCNIVPDKKIKLPYAYVIGREWIDVVERLLCHQVVLDRVSQTVKVKTEAVRLSKVSFSRQPYEGRIRPSYSVRNIDTSLVIDDEYYIIPVQQSAVRIIVNLLEAESDMSFLKWGFFNAIFEQKEYGESYVLEPLARKMLDADPALKMEYEKIKISDTAFAKDPYAQLNWFYEHSLWRDDKMNLYPVFKITSESEWQKLIFKN